ncbi:MAG: hydrogenase maturation protease [Kiritimatiellaeota bacterium]|nr:hydrogenase maturation protease [Kiritimatiellota bacterium]
MAFFCFGCGIKKFAPTHLVIVDAADLGRPPGTIAVLEPEQIAGVSFSTHQMPLSVLLDYLKTSFAFAAIVVAIQPAQLTYDQPVTPAVRRAARRLAAALAATLHR